MLTCRAMTTELFIHWEGATPNAIHIHIGQDNTAVLDRLTTMETTMSDINAAVSANTAALEGVKQRVTEDVSHLQDLLAQALQTDITNAAEVQRLTNEAAAAVQRINEATASMSAIDPVPDFPAAPPATPPATPADTTTPPAEQPPADTAIGGQQPTP